jgi:hypothetical protein
MRSPSENPHDADLPPSGAWGAVLWPLFIGLALALVIIGALYGCAPAPQPPPQLVTYSPEFAKALAGQLRTAPPELATFAVDYIKLRCTIKPEMAVCTDLLK